MEGVEGLSVRILPEQAPALRFPPSGEPVHSALGPMQNPVCFPPSSDPVHSALAPMQIPPSGDPVHSALGPMQNPV